MGRGQTTIDFAFGVSIFMLSIFFVFIFVPSLFSPYESQQEDIGKANRVANTLTGDILLDTKNPQKYVLDRSCTVSYFSNFEGRAVVSKPFDGCRFDTPISSLQEDIAIGDFRDVNVTIEDTEPDGDDIIDISDDRGNSVEASIGDNPPSSQKNVVVVYRDVYIDGEMFRLKVRVW